MFVCLLAVFKANPKAKSLFFFGGDPFEGNPKATLQFLVTPVSAYFGVFFLRGTQRQNHNVGSPPQKDPSICAELFFRAQFLCGFKGNPKATSPFWVVVPAQKKNTHTENPRTPNPKDQVPARNNDRNAQKLAKGRKKKKKMRSGWLSGSFGNSRLCGTRTKNKVATCW